MSIKRRMSLVLVRKISKGSFCWKQGIRCFSSTSTSSLRPVPYLLLPMDSPGEKVVKFNLYDPGKKKTLVMTADQTLSEDLYQLRYIGSSRGWVALMNNEDSTIRLNKMFHPNKGDIYFPPLHPPFNPAVDFSLPHLNPYLPLPVSDIVQRMSLSSSPDQGRCITAVKWEKCVSFCNLGDPLPSWSHVQSLPDCYIASGLLYSDKDSLFYLMPNTEFLDFDPSLGNTESLPLTYFQQSGPLELPKMSESELELFAWCVRIKRLVESPHDLFLLTCCMEFTSQGKPIPYWECEELEDYEVKTKGFMVHRQDIDKGVERYTENIGDHCIFFGMNEEFCVHASMYPGLKPNSVYFIDHHRAYRYDIAARIFKKLGGQPRRFNRRVNFWLAPILEQLRIKRCLWTYPYYYNSKIMFVSKTPQGFRNAFLQIK